MLQNLDATLPDNDVCMMVVAFQGRPSLFYNSTCACMQVWSTKGGWAKPDLPLPLAMAMRNAEVSSF